MSAEAEWLTRKSRIDAKLKQNGWHLVRFSPDLDLKNLDKTAVEELPTASGPADYALFVAGRCLGIIEAKKVTVNPQNVLEQAKRYARGIFDAVGEWNGFGVPFLYASNGTIIWHVDTRPEKLVSRTISDFHTPDALEARFTHGTTAARNYLLDTPIEQIGRLRPYQRDCILAADQIDARYAKAKAHVEKLTQSILAKAFRSELVPKIQTTNPLLFCCSGSERTEDSLTHLAAMGFVRTGKSESVRKKRRVIRSDPHSLNHFFG